MAGPAGGGGGGVVVLDGQALRGRGPTQLVGAIAAGSGRTLGVEPVADPSNEIPAGQTLLARLDLEGTLALMEALPPQVQTARAIVQAGGGDYVLFVKGNPAGLQNQARHFLPEDLSPSVPNRGCRPRANRMARQSWSLENGTHDPLEVSAGEDRGRVRHPVAATGLGILRRAVQGEARAWARRQPRARDRTCPTFLAKMSRRRGELSRCITRPVRR